MKEKQVLIIGGGSAGLLAAAFLGKSGLGSQITVLEKESRVGRKLLATGNGRCNLTNRDAMDVSHYDGSEPKDILSYLEQWSVNDTLKFFEQIGIVPYELEKGRIYPRSLQANAVVDSLREACSQYDVLLETEVTVTNINYESKKKQYQITCNDGVKRRADIVLMAAGGKSSPSLGSDGSGIALMQQMGHDSTSLYPAMVQLQTETDFISSVRGIKFEGVATLFDDEKKLGSEKGEILFTESGLSGLPIFQLSIYAAECWNKKRKKKLTLSLDFLPEYSENELYDVFKERQQTLSYRSIENFMVGLLPRRIAMMLCKHESIVPFSRTADTLSNAELKKMAAICKQFMLSTTGNRSFEHAQVTVGGLVLDDFDENLESKLYPNLFATGEMLNVHGDCGGFNLQWAWTSAHIAAVKIQTILQNEK